MSDLAVGSIKVDAFTLYREDGFASYTASMKLITPSSVVKTLTGAVDTSDSKLYHIATTLATDLPEAGTYDVQVTLTHASNGDVILTAPFEIYIHPAI